MSGVFSITGDAINRLSSEDCVKLFGELLHLDARRLELSISKIHFTAKTVSDGGIDASIEDGISEIGDLIIDSESFYQIKAGDTFKPWQESEIRKELLDNKESKQENLGLEVQRCIAQNGTYILACMKVSLTTEQKTKAEMNLKTILGECGVSNPKIKVFDQEQILGIIQKFPSLVLRLTNRNSMTFQTHQEWAQTEEMRKELVLGDEQKKFIVSIHDALFNDSEPIHVNVHGETGVGKTRLILEATRDPFLAPSVIYCSSPRDFLSSSLLATLIRDTSLHCILVIDECDLAERLRIWDQIKNTDNRIKLVTIYNEFRRTDGTTKQIQTPNLSDEDIQKIIQTYRDDSIIARQLSGICGGIPRFAHVLGFELKNDSELLGGIPDTFDIFDRYLNYGEDPNSEHVKQRKRILSSIAVFKKFGNSKHFPEEIKAVHELVKQIDPNITFSIFQEHIKELQGRKILQGEDTLYISPKGLHLWLWKRWWDEYSSSFNFDKLVENLPPQLREWFFAMFEYAANSDVTSSIVKGLFDDGGPLHNSDSIKTELGSKFFKSLSFVDPTAATNYLENSMSSWSQNDFSNFNIGRREVLNGLERIVFEPDLFYRGGKLLRSLAEFENEEWSNNATGLFANLFSLGPGYVSITKTPPEKRIPLLKETLCENNTQIRKLGLMACESALQAVHFSRVSGLSGNELIIDQKGWEPKTYQEWTNAYQGVIDVMIEKIPSLSEKDQKKIAEIIFNNSRGILGHVPNMGNYLIKTLSNLLKYVDKEFAIKEIIDILEFDGDKLPTEIKQSLKKIYDNLSGKEYPDLMKRYVGMDMMVDRAREKREGERKQMINQLAKESLDLEKLKTQLPWLVTFDAKAGYQFGYELSTMDADHELLNVILDFQKKSNQNGSPFFLSGYMQKIFEEDAELWTKLMKDLSNDKEFLRFYIEIAWRSGITDEIGILLLDLIEKNKINIDELAHFQLGSVINKLSENVVKKWIEKMLENNQQKTIISAITLFNTYFVFRMKKPLDLELTSKLLTHEVLFDKKYPPVYNTMIDYYWKEITLEFIKQFPDKALMIADKMLENMGRDGTIVRTHSQSMEVLDVISNDFPNDIWELITKYVDLPFDERAFDIINWMRGGMFETTPNFIEKVNFEKIFDWIDHDPNRRASFIINYVPPILKKEKCLARELLIRYGQDESVKRSLLSNFSTGFFSGPASVQFENEKQELLEYKKTEDNDNVKEWIDYYVKKLDEDIERERLREEREYY
ncbi:MAG: ATP-binding protein [Nitrosarchaeum sp.]|nr:ATP-binding protein [Nitrosarchaeum sp.]